MEAKSILAVCALCVAGLLGLSEVAYYLSHPHNAGVSPHLVGLSVAIILTAVAQLVGRAKPDGVDGGPKPKRPSKLLIGAVLVAAVAVCVASVWATRHRTNQQNVYDRILDEAEAAVEARARFHTPEYCSLARQAFERGCGVADIAAARPNWARPAIAAEHTAWQHERAAWRLWSSTGQAFRGRLAAEETRADSQPPKNRNATRAPSAADARMRRNPKQPPDLFPEVKLPTSGSSKDFGPAHKLGGKRPTLDRMAAIPKLDSLHAAYESVLDAEARAAWRSKPPVPSYASAWAGYDEAMRRRANSPNSIWAGYDAERAAETVLRFAHDLRTRRLVLRRFFEDRFSVDDVAVFTNPPPKSLVEAEHYAWLRDKAAHAVRFKTQECRRVVRGFLADGLSVDEITEARPSWSRAAIQVEYDTRQLESLLYDCNSRVRRAWALAAGCLVVLFGATVTAVRRGRRKQPARPC